MWGDRKMRRKRGGGWRAKRRWRVNLLYMGGKVAPQDIHRGRRLHGLDILMWDREGTLHLDEGTHPLVMARQDSVERRRSLPLISSIQLSNDDGADRGSGVGELRQKSRRAKEQPDDSKQRYRSEQDRQTGTSIREST